MSTFVYLVKIAGVLFIAYNLALVIDGVLCWAIDKMIGGDE